MTADPLAPLRARFAGKAGEEAAVLKGYGSGDLTATEAEHIVHGLAGAAGLFGFSELSSLARGIDERFAAGQPPTSSELQPLIDVLETLARDYS